MKKLTIIAFLFTSLTLFGQEGDILIGGYVHGWKSTKNASNLKIDTNVISQPTVKLKSYDYSFTPMVEVKYSDRLSFGAYFKYSYTDFEVHPYNTQIDSIANIVKKSNGGGLFVRYNIWIKGDFSLFVQPGILGYFENILHYDKSYTHTKSEYYGVSIPFGLNYELTDRLRLSCYMELVSAKFEIPKNGLFERNLTFHLKSQLIDGLNIGIQYNIKGKSNNGRKQGTD